jgi:hypothetical protein
LEQLNAGALLRIADATEKMAQGHSKLLADVDFYKRQWESAKEINKRLSRQVSAYRGVLKRRKNRDV